MPAEVESLAYVRDVPWHSFGTKVDGLMTAAECIEAAGLDWEVVQKGIYTHNSKGQMVKIEGRVANVRKSDGKPLGVVSPSYKVIQNSTAFDLADAIVETGEAKYETAGSLRGGKIVFLSMEIPKTIKIAGDDGVIQPYLLVANGHDGMMAGSARITKVRVVCKNTLDMAFGGSSSTFKWRHTLNVMERVAEAQKALGLIFEHLDGFAATAEKLMLFKPDQKEILRTLLACYPIKDVNPMKLSATELRRVIGADASQPAAKALSMYETSPNIANVRDTGWGLYNAIAEFVDYGTSYRSREASAGDNRAANLMGLRGTAAAKKERAATMILSLS